MPFRHVVMYRWADHVDDDHVTRVRDALDELAGVVRGLRHHAHGSDVGVSADSFDFHLVADFDAVWDVLTPENRGRLLRAIVQRVEVNEPENQVTVILADLGAEVEVAPDQPKAQQEVSP